MKKYQIAFWFYFIFFSLLIGVHPGWAVKARPPLQLSLFQTPLSDHQNRLVLSATANIDATEVELSLDLPPDLTLIEGAAGWKGPLQKGETQKVEVVVQGADRAPREVTGKAAIHLAEGGTFFQKSALTLNKPKNKSAPDTPTLKKKDGGENILEFKGR